MKQNFQLRVSALHLRAVPSSHVQANWVRNSFQEKHTQLEYKSKPKMSEFSWCSRNTRPLSLNTLSAVSPYSSEAHKEIPYVKQDLLQTLYMIKFLLSFRQGKINLTLKQSKCWSNMCMFSALSLESRACVSQAAEISSETNRHWLINH